MSGTNYKDCVVFKTDHLKALPKEIISTKYKQLRYRRTLKTLLSLVSFIIVLFVLIFAIHSFVLQGETSTPDISEGTQQPILGIQSSEENLILQSPTTPITTNAACSIDPDWIQYTVKPTDSIFRISLLYNISVESILAANCLGDETYIAPHQVIYIPIKPTPTVTITTTPTATRRIIILPTATQNPPKEPTRVPPSATFIPPTATNPPPTATQPPPTATNPPPTETEIPTPTLPVLPTQPNP